MNKAMTWTLWSEFYGKFLELHLVTAWDMAWTWLLSYSWSTATHPDQGFTLPNSEPSPSLSDVHSIVSLKVMGHATLLGVAPKKNLEEPAEHHLVPWHALTDTW